MSRPEPGTLGTSAEGVDETKVCPYCAETVKAAAIKCRFCQSDLVATTSGRSSWRPARRPAGRPSRRPAPAVRRGRPAGRERTLLVVTAALSLVVTLVLGVMALTAWRDAEDREAAGAAGRAARATVPAHLETVLSYEWSTFDADLEAASEVMTPSFREEYLPTVEAVRERAVEQERTQQAAVVAVSVVSEEEDRVETLVFLNRTTFTEKSPRQQVLQDRANVTVVREDGEWLIDAITFPTS